MAGQGQPQKCPHGLCANHQDRARHHMASQSGERTRLSVLEEKPVRVGFTFLFRNKFNLLDFLTRSSMGT